MKCIEDEIPFEVPEGWAWVRLGAISNIVTGKLDANAQTVDGEYPFFTCGKEVFKTNSYAFDCNAILLGGNNATGDFKMHKYSGKFNAYQRVYVISTCLEIGRDYLYNHIEYYLPKLQTQSIGSQTRYLKLGMITDLLIALPPLAEQKSISEVSNKYLKYCEIILDERNDLCEIIKNARCKILDLAIRGKLVPQDPNDEPASALLECIRAEKEELIKQGKIKREKKESIIFKGDDNSYFEKIENDICDITNNIPFEIPDSWTWCRLKSVACNENNSFVDGPFGSDLKTIHYTEKGEVRIVQLNNIGEEGWRNTGKKYTTFSHAKNIERCISFPNDIVISKMMPAGRAIILPKTNNIYVISSDCIRLRADSRLCRQYLILMLNSPSINQLVLGTVQGIGRTRTSLNKMRDILVPIPPISEQIKISKMVNTYLNYLNCIYEAL